MNRTGLRKTIAEGMVAADKQEEDEKSGQYDADCSMDFHLCQYPDP
jgi:hypothetical protein